MYDIFKLNNGLRIVVENIDHVNSVSVGIWIENGSRNENTDNSGISHFIEHMFFKGTEKRTAKEIAEEIENVGGQLNAFTGKEATCFYVKSLDSHLELGLDVLADMLFYSKFSEEEIEKEKGVIVEEINMTEDSPEDVLMDLHNRAIWGSDSISLPILGTIDTVRSFTKKQLVEYVSSYYIPENSVISIAGKFDKSKIQALIEKYFGHWKSENKKITHYSKPALLNNHLFRTKSIEQVHLSIGMQGIEIGNDDIYGLLILNNILGGGASSILFQKIREDLGLCYSIYSYISAFNNTGAVSIYTGLNPIYTTQVVGIIQEELQKFLIKGVDLKKLTTSKEQLKGNYILGLESTSSRMFTNGKSVLFLNKISSPKEIIEKIDRIDCDKIQKIMMNTLGKGILNSAFVGENLNIKEIAAVVNGDVVAYDNKVSTEV